MANETFKFVAIKTLKTLISTRKFLQRKFNKMGEVEGYKVRLVKYRFQQRLGIVFDKTLAPLFNIVIVCFTLVVLGSYMTMKYLDIMIAFLESKVKKKYMWPYLK